MGRIDLGARGLAGSVGGTLIADNAVVGSHISADAVVGSHISAGVIQASHLAAGVSGKPSVMGMAGGLCNGTNKVFTATGTLTPTAFGVHPMVDGIFCNDNVTDATDATDMNQVYFASTDAVVFTLGAAPPSTSSVFTLTIQ